MINSLLLILNKNKAFYSYKTEIYKVVPKTELIKYSTYKYTIISGIKDKLGKSYKIANYKISGPNFTSISFGTKKFLNAQKTDYVKSKNKIYFEISSLNLNTLLRSKELIKKNYLDLIKYVSDLELFNYVNFLSDKINFLCNSKKLSYKIDRETCLNMFLILDKAKNDLNNIDLVNYKISEVQKNNEKISLKIIEHTQELKEILIGNNEFKKKSIFLYESILSDFQILKNISLDEKLNKNFKNNILIKNIFLENDITINNYFGKVIVYANLLILLIFFLTLYFRDLLKKN